MPFYNGASGKVPLRMQCVLLIGVNMRNLLAGCGA